MTNLSNKFKNIIVKGVISNGVTTFTVVRDGRSLTIKIRGIKISSKQERDLFTVLQMLDQASEFEFFQVWKKLPHTYLV